MKNDRAETGGSSVRQAPRLTGRGTWLLRGSLGLLLAGVIVANAILIELALFFLTLILVASIACQLNCSRLTFSHLLPEGVFSDQDFEMLLSVANSKRVLASLDAAVSCRLAKRTRKILFGSVQPQDIESRIAIDRIRGRGIHQNLWYRIHSRFPLGLAEQKKEGSCQCRLVVYPRPRLPSHVRDILETSMGYGRNSRISATDVSGNFKLMRDYYPGDRAKLISWPASQRRGKLIVKDMECPGPQQITILFHSFQPPGVVLSRRSFENALQILSGMFTHLLKNGLPIRFLASFNNWAPAQIGADRTSQQNGFLLLASAIMAPSGQASDFVSVLQREDAKNTPIMVLSNTPVRFWREFVPIFRVPTFCADNTEAVEASHEGW